VICSFFHNNKFNKYSNYTCCLNSGANFYITVGNPPAAAFTGTPTKGTAPLSVSFTDQSSGTITSRQWEFGDGGTSTAKDPSHTFNSAGTFTVKLTVSNEFGSDDETKSNYITVGDSPVAAFSVSNTSINQGENLQFTDQSTNQPTSWSWDFGDGSTSI
jgi:PKD repeat protein